MRLTFLGTRGEIEARTHLHQRHTCTLVSYRRRRILLDAGLDWLGRLDQINPHIILLTHAHPDHAWGLRDGSPCPVYATETTWKLIDQYPIRDRHVLPTGKTVAIFGLKVLAFDVEHSIRCPAVGFRIESATATFVYCPDVLYIPNSERFLKGADLYVGDGATITRSFVRKRGDKLIGHATVSAQLTWCRKQSIPHAIITHCGSEIVSDHESAEKTIARLAEQRHVAAQLACDGLEISLPFKRSKRHERSRAKKTSS